VQIVRSFDSLKTDYWSLINENCPFGQVNTPHPVGVKEMGKA